MLKFISRIWFRRWLYTCIVIAAILYLTLVPRPLPPEMDMDIPGLDKLVHAIMFGGLAGTACIDYAYRRRSFAPLTAKAAAAIAAAATAAGGLIEIAQQQMALGRGGDPLDFLADAIGAALGAFIAFRILKNSFL